MGPVVSDIETNYTLNRFRQSSDFSAHILQYMVKRLFTNRVQYPLKLKVFGALWSPFFTIGNWLLTLWPPFLQWCEDRNVNRIGPEYNQSTQKSYIIWGLIFLLVSSYLFCNVETKVGTTGQNLVYTHTKLIKVYFVTCQFMCSFWSNPRTEWLKSVQDFLIKLDMKSCMHLVEIGIFH